MAKGEKNSYTCIKCRQQIITIDSNDGTTPMGIRCRATKGCDGPNRTNVELKPGN